LGLLQKIIFERLQTRLVLLETEIASFRHLPNLTTEAACYTISIKLKEYLEEAGDEYDGYPEQKSIVLLLVMRL
jgi:hypothetical protein